MKADNAKQLRALNLLREKVREAAALKLELWDKEREIEQVFGFDIDSIEADLDEMCSTLDAAEAPHQETIDHYLDKWEALKR